MSRSYRTVARVAEAELQVKRSVFRCRIELDHAVAGRVESDLRTRGCIVLDTHYAEAVTVRLGVPDGAEAELAATVAELTGGAVEPVRTGESWVDVP